MDVIFLGAERFRVTIHDFIVLVALGLVITGVILFSQWSRDVFSGFDWLFFVAIGCIVVGLATCFVIGAVTSTDVCPSCESVVENTDIYCAECGYQLISTCPSCGAVPEDGDVYCSKCGESVQG